MADGIADNDKFKVREDIVVAKFEGDEQTPENLVEQVYLEDGAIVKHEFFEQGNLVRTINFNEGGDADAAS